MCRATRKALHAALCWCMITRACAITMNAVAGSPVDTLIAVWRYFVFAEEYPLEAAGKVQHSADRRLRSGSLGDRLSGAKLFTGTSAGGSTSRGRPDGSQRTG